MRVPALAAVRRVLARHAEHRTAVQVAVPVLLAAALVAGGQLLVAGGGSDTGTPATVTAANRAVIERSARLAETILGAASVRPAPPAGIGLTDPARRPARASRTVSRRPAPRPEWVRPAYGPLTSHFGPRWGRMHKGIDIGARYGSPIYAAGDGVVTSAGTDGGYGRLVTVRHAGGVVTAYAHMSRIAVHGGRVHAGQVIGYVGSSGHSTGPHLHFEVRVGGAAINPLPWLRKHGVRI